MPRYRSYVARARQAEAQNNLAEIRKLQKSYSYEYGGAFFSGLHYGLDKCDRTPTEENNLLGFRLEDCTKARYRYITNAGNDCAKSDGTLDQGQIYPGCTADDEWHMSIKGKLTHTQDVISKCPHGGSPPASTCVAVALPAAPAVSTPTGGRPPSGCTNTCPTGHTLEADCSCTAPLPVRRPPSVCTNTCPTGHTLETDCSCTPPTCTFSCTPCQKHNGKCARQCTYHNCKKQWIFNCGTACISSLPSACTNTCPTGHTREADCSCTPPDTLSTCERSSCDCNDCCVIHSLVESPFGCTGVGSRIRCDHKIETMCSGCSNVCRIEIRNISCRYGINCSIYH